MSSLTFKIVFEGGEKHKVTAKRKNKIIKILCVKTINN